MNKRILNIGISLVLAFSLVGCKKSANAKRAAGPPPPIPTGPVELKIKWSVGDRITQDMEMNQTSETLLPNMPSPLKQQTQMQQRYALSVAKERPGGGYEIDFQMQSIRFVSAAAGRTNINFDSAKGSAEAKDPIASVFQKLTGVQLRFLLDASNRVEGIEGVDEMQKKLTAGNSRDTTGVAALLGGVFNEDYFKQMVDMNHMLPDKPVQPGDTWPVKYSAAMGGMGTMTLEYTCTFRDWETRDQRNYVRIGFEGTIQSRMPTNAKGGISMTIDSGKSSGDMLFDPSAGMFEESSMDQQMTMRMTIPAQARGGARTAQTLTNLVSQAVTTKRVQDK